jgi:hypothetical protein
MEGQDHHCTGCTAGNQDMHDLWPSPSPMPVICVRLVARASNTQSGCDAFDVTGVFCTMYCLKLVHCQGGGRCPVRLAPSIAMFSNCDQAEKRTGGMVPASCVLVSSNALRRVHETNSIGSGPLMAPCALQSYIHSSTTHQYVHMHPRRQTCLLYQTYSGHWFSATQK